MLYGHIETLVKHNQPLYFEVPIILLQLQLNPSKGSLDMTGENNTDRQTDRCTNMLQPIVKSYNKQFYLFTKHTTVTVMVAEL